MLLVATSGNFLVDVYASTAYLGDGLRDGLIMRLSRLQSLRINSHG